MSSKIKLKFGKYCGFTPKVIAQKDAAYLEWVLSTDIPDRYPGLSIEIRKAMKPELTIELEQVDLPDLTMHCDGDITEGSSAAILTPEGYCTVDEIQIDDQRSSSSENHGDITQVLPPEDMVILVSKTTLESVDPDPVTTWMVRIDGDWNRIIPNNRTAAKAVLELM